LDEKLARKLRILADAAKYDASCASSGAPKRAAGVDGIGSTSNGICHAYTPDGRCVSLLKILLTNFCQFDCAYCINRISSNIPRARFRVEDVVTLTIEFYKRNYIEGLFLSSGIIRSPDYTMEQMVLAAKTLRQQHRFAGYIHLKTIPEASPLLIEQAGLWADRLSINIELPTEHSLRSFAPDKSGASIRSAMGQMRTRIEGARADRRRYAGRAEHAGYRGRRCNDRCPDAGDHRRALSPICTEQSLLFRVQPNPRFQQHSPFTTAAIAARAPPIPGRLAVASLRLQRARGRCRHR
jgi:predicted DNA-binding helix-hairpin-helix protein